MNQPISSQLEKALLEAQYNTCWHCGKKVYQAQNVYDWQCCEKKLLDYVRACYPFVPNPEIKNLK